MKILSLANKNLVKEVYAVDDYDFNSETTIFLAGPTPRAPKVKSWRPEAITLLKKHGFKGAVFIPETEDGKWNQTYIDQIEWEHKLLNGCTYILMWVPRELTDMPAFTTNIEFGMYLESDRLYYGRPNDAPKTKYMDYCYQKSTKRKCKNTLDKLIIEIINNIKENGERCQ